MNAIREIKKVKNGKIEIDIPVIFEVKEVEVIVLTISDYSKEKISKLKRKKCIMKFGGILNEYAKLELIPFEKNAWPNAVKDKHSLNKL